MSTVRLEKIGTIAIVTLNRPEAMNSFGNAHIPAILDALKMAESDPAIGAIVLTGAGRGFSAGGDRAAIAETMQGGVSQDLLPMLAEMQRLIIGIRNSPLPIVAAVHGAAFGAGFSLALACDLIVVTRDARLCMAFAKLGLAADMGAAWLATQAIGPHRAKELILLAGEISGEQASQLGIANRVAEDQDAMMAEARDLATRLARFAPAARALNKNLINRSGSMSLDDFLSFEQHAVSIAVTQAMASQSRRASQA